MLGGGGEGLFDLVQNYFDLLGMAGPLESIGRLVSALDQGIGYYGDLKRTAFWRMFSPVTWLAWFVRLPLTVLERAGVASSNRIYGWFIQGLVALILALVAQKLGLPLDKILERFGVK